MLKPFGETARAGAIDPSMRLRGDGLRPWPSPSRPMVGQPPVKIETADENGPCLRRALRLCRPAETHCGRGHRPARREPASGSRSCPATIPSASSVLQGLVGLNAEQGSSGRRCRRAQLLTRWRSGCRASTPWPPGARPEIPDRQGACGGEGGGRRLSRRRHQRRSGAEGRRYRALGRRARPASRRAADMIPCWPSIPRVWSPTASRKAGEPSPIS